MSNYPPTPLTGGTEAVRASPWFALEIDSMDEQFLFAWRSETEISGARIPFRSQKPPEAYIDLTRHDQLTHRDVAKAINDLTEFLGWRKSGCQAEFCLRRTGWSAYCSRGSIRTSKATSLPSR
jgi:hypothetical protein